MMGIFDAIRKVFSAADKPEPVEPPELAEPPPTEPTAPPPNPYIEAIEVDRAEKDRFFRISPYSPIEDRTGFSGLNYYPPDPAFRYTLALQRAEQPEPLTFQTNTGDERVYYRLGTLSFEVAGQPTQLAIYKSEEHNELFLPFRDATSNQETYGAGRYLEPEALPNGQLLVDFNRAYNPFCAYSADFSCPLPPFENHLTVAIQAGEKMYQKPDETA